MSSIRSFVPLSKIGEGTYSTVYKVQRRSDGKIYALKKVKITQLSKKEQENALNEIRILASFQSPSIISYKEAFFDEDIKVLCIVMEYADGGDLHHLITQKKKQRATFPEEQIWEAVRKMLLGLQNLHSRGIMHRDLKSANVFKTSEGYKLGDLNVSKVVTGQLAYTQTGTPYYASPQVWRDEPYDCRSDIWSLGCIVYEMAALKPPYQGKDLEELYRNVQKKPIPSIPEKYSDQLVSLIGYCLHKNPARRPTASQLLKFPLFQKYFNPGHYSTQLEKKLQKPQSAKQLLQTIKLPSDLKNLKDKLPDSKYESEKMINKSALVNNYHSRGSSSQRTPIHQQNINKSEVFRSPSSRLNREQSVKVTRSPVSEVKLNPKLSQVVAKYSDRIYQSDKKSNKVERAGSRNYEQGYLKIEKYIKEQIFNRPGQQISIPRTQKQSQKGVLPYSIKSQNHLPSDIEQLRKKLVKKGRILSSNAKPSWWG